MHTITASFSNVDVLKNATQRLGLNDGTCLAMKIVMDRHNATQLEQLRLTIYIIPIRYVYLTLSIKCWAP